MMWIGMGAVGYLGCVIVAYLLIRQHVQSISGGWWTLHDRWFVGSLALTGPLGMLIAIVMQIANKVPHRDPNIRAEW